MRPVCRKSRSAPWWEVHLARRPDRLYGTLTRIIDLKFTVTLYIFPFVITLTFRFCNMEPGRLVCLDTVHKANLTAAELGNLGFPCVEQVLPDPIIGSNAIVPGLDRKDVDVIIRFGIVFLEILEEGHDLLETALAEFGSCVIGIWHNYEESIIVPELPFPLLNGVRSGGIS